MKDSPHRLRLHCNSAIPERYRDSMRNLLAFDLGASNGRAILGRFDGTRVTLHELHRFENNYIEMNGVFYWDLPYLYQQLKLGFLAFRQANMGELDCFGIDAWGVDYGLLDKNGNLLSNPRAYRYAREEDMSEVWKQLDFADIFARTGIAAMNFNTIFQLMRRRCEDDAALQNAETLLLMPDLLGYFLTGEKASEYTNVTTTMLYSPEKRDWDREIICKLGLPERIFTRIDYAGDLRGKLRSELAKELGINQAAFAAVGTHDTASAVAAIPGNGNFAFCSSGTWSLFGVETDRPVLERTVRVHLKALWDCGSFKSAAVNGKRKERYTLGMRSWIRQNRQSPSDLSSTRIMENSSPAGECLKKYKAFAEEQTSRFPRALGRWRAVSMNPLH